MDVKPEEALQDFNCEEANSRRLLLHDILLKNSDKLETLITQISSVFLGATASFYALTKMPISNSGIWAIIGFLSCIVLNCSSYLISIHALKFAIRAEDPREKDLSELSEKLDRVRETLDQGVVFIFILSLALASIVTYREYNQFLVIENKLQQKGECMSVNETSSGTGTRGLGLPPKKIKPPKDKK